MLLFSDFYYVSPLPEFTTPTLPCIVSGDLNILSFFVVLKYPLLVFYATALKTSQLLYLSLFLFILLNYLFHIKHF